MGKLIIGEPYQVSPSAVRIDQEMVEFNRVHTDIEYEATKLSIQSIGQVSPIAINSKTGLMEDGRHRLRACKELGIDVSCIEVDGEMDKGVRIEYYNLDAMSGRDLTVAQKAIQAHKFSTLTGTYLDVAAKKFKSTVRNINDANAIAGLGRTDVLDTIMATGEWVLPNGKPSKSLRAIVSALKAEAENITVDTSQTPKVDYEAMIVSNTGKTEFWRARTVAQMDVHALSMFLVELMRYKYDSKINKETGEITDDK